MSKQEGTIGSLRELPRDIPPARDLWPAIEARLAQESRAATGSGASESPGRVLRLRLISVAAMIAMLGVGIWIGRSEWPLAGKPARPVPELAARIPAGEPEALQAAYMMDPRYVRDRAALVQSLEKQLEALPPESRAKVMSSLSTIQSSKRDLEAALGRDPSNALLQELLVNTYQDEMRVLTAVHEAGNAGKGI